VSLKLYRKFDCGCMQVGRGLSKDEKGLKLGPQHWLEAVC